MSDERRHVVTRKVVQENEAAARRAYGRGEYVICFLLAHVLVEALLRAFLGRTGRESFSDLVATYDRYLDEQGQERSTFVEELIQFNRRRNRVVHDLWAKGYVSTNEELELASHAAFIMYGLFIEWLETFDPDVTDTVFEYE